MNLSIHDKLHNNLYCCNCCNFAEFLNPYLDESKVAWHKTLSAQTSQPLLLCMYPSISMMTTIKCLLYALEYQYTNPQKTKLSWTENRTLHSIFLKLERSRDVELDIEVHKSQQIDMYQDLQMQFLLSHFLSILVSSIVQLVYNFKVFLNIL